MTASSRRIFNDLLWNSIESLQQRNISSSFSEGIKVPISRLVLGRIQARLSDIPYGIVSRALQSVIEFRDPLSRLAAAPFAEEPSNMAVEADNTAFGAAILVHFLHDMLIFATVYIDRVIERTLGCA